MFKVTVKVGGAQMDSEHEHRVFADSQADVWRKLYPNGVVTVEDMTTPTTATKTFSIYYMRPDFFRDGIMGADWLKRHDKMPDASALDTTHIFLREIEADTPAHAFHLMQGENWSPNGEARGLIERKGLQHTSMSTGDIIVDQATNETLLIGNYGMHLLRRGDQ